ncbi:hypothetical protein [Aurantiacibacter sp. MUD61]|uniref:hypothetical protein n=1 Tax=Aurantiacibacter sp. MUD61 TaxID=3009083 RepID=UPI0022F06431|nr:hypothetical protein [Aurantiacibacter sp. MUD61]
MRGNPKFQIFLMVVCFAFGIWVGIQSWNGLEGSSTLWRFIGPVIAGFLAMGLAVKVLEFLQIMKLDVVDEAVDRWDEEDSRK